MTFFATILQLASYLSSYPIGLRFRGGRKNRKNRPRTSNRPAHRINKYIRASELRVLGAEGEMYGVMKLSEALSKAAEAGLDLVEVSPKAVPPVARILDYGKMLYAEQKKAQEQKKHQKKLETKGIRLSFRMAEGDMERQKKHTQEFLQGGHPVRVQLKLRGREKAHYDIAYDKLNAFVASLAEFGSVDQPASSSGGQVTALLKPKAQKK